MPLAAARQVLTSTPPKVLVKVSQVQQQTAFQSSTACASKDRSGVQQAPVLLPVTVLKSALPVTEQEMLFLVYAGVKTQQPLIKSATKTVETTPQFQHFPQQGRSWRWSKMATLLNWTFLHMVMFSELQQKTTQES